MTKMEEMVRPKNILAPVDPDLHDLNAVHYALALAKRIKAGVILLRREPESGFRDPKTAWMEDALADLVHNARQAGLDVSWRLTRRVIGDEVEAMVHEEGVDIVVIGPDQRDLERRLKRIGSELAGRIIQVREKDEISNLGEGEGGA